MKYVGKLEDGTVFEKKGHDEELFQFVTDEGTLPTSRKFIFISTMEVPFSSVFTYILN